MTKKAFARIKIDQLPKGTDCVRPMASACGTSFRSPTMAVLSRCCSIVRDVYLPCSKPRARASVSARARRKAAEMPAPGDRFEADIHVHDRMSRIDFEPSF